MASGSEGEGAGDGVVEIETEVDGGVVLEVIGAVVAGVAFVAVVLVGGEAVLEMGEGAPVELAGLGDAGLGEAFAVASGVQSIAASTPSPRCRPAPRARGPLMRRLRNART